MKKFVLSFIAIAALGLGAHAQDTAPAQQPRPQNGGNLFQQLALTGEQLKQIRELNQQRKPQMEDAQRRVREAGKALDLAIYSDSVDDNEVRMRLADLQQAQADVARIRFTNELAIRRVLSPEQLGHFRELRQRIAEARKQADSRDQEERAVSDRSQTLRDGRQMRRLIRQQNLQGRGQSVTTRTSPANPAAPAVKPKP